MSSLIYLGQVLSSCCFFYGSVWVLTTNVPRCIRVGVSARDVRVRAKAMLSGQNRPARLWKWKRNIHFNASPKNLICWLVLPRYPLANLTRVTGLPMQHYARTSNAAGGKGSSSLVFCCCYLALSRTFPAF